MNNYSIFMEAISGLGLTSPQMEALSNLYKISANRPKINGENLGDIINYIMKGWMIILIILYRNRIPRKNW